MTEPLVLDTHVWIWLINGDKKLSSVVVRQIEEKAREGQVFIPAICVWEVALLEKRGRLAFSTDIGQWVDQALSAPGIQLMALTPDIAIDSCHLSEPFHPDPADRLIVATARALNARLVTGDERIMAYGKEGHLKVLTA
jgi:PIN domain nuclease of toxin-antitoxin system